MAITHKVTRSWIQGSNQLPTSVSYSADGEISLEVAVPASTTNQALNVNFAYAGLQLIFILCDQDILLKVNDTGSPDLTIHLKAGIPYLWAKDNSSNPYFDNPFSNDVTVIYATTGAIADDANLSIRVLATL